MINLYKQATAVATTLLLSLFLLPACSDGEGGGPEVPETRFAKLTITLASAESSKPAYTKATDDGIRTFENKVSDYHIIVVDAATEQVEEVISGTKNFVESYTEESIKLPIGKSYSFYALANLDGLADKSAITSVLKALKGKGFDDNDFRETAATLKEMTAYAPGGTTYIPMSSYKSTATVSENEDDNKVTVELIRLIGKISVKVTNATQSDVTVESLTMDKFRQSGSVYLWPYDMIESDPQQPNLLLTDGEENDFMDPSFPGNKIEGTRYTYLFSSSDEKKIAVSAEKDYTFYINETDRASVGNEIEINLKLDGIIRDEEAKPTGFSFVRRNDWLQIPILVSDARTTITFEQKHMPIGGLPAKIVFEEGATVANKSLKTTHAGDITITYELEGLEGAVLQYYKKGAEALEKSEKCCYAGLLTNNNDFLLEPAAKDELSYWWTDKKGNIQYGYVLTPDGNTKGSFTITAQELGYGGTATIDLTLVAKLPSGSMVALPYTLTITNGKTAKPETMKGGNL